MEKKSYQIVICAASAYDQKYYFNHTFDKLPGHIKDQLQIICVLFTQEIGGILTIAYTPFGDVEIISEKEEGDLLYDDIGAPLMIKEIRKTRREMLEALSIYYRVTFLHQDPGELLEDWEEE